MTAPPDPVASPSSTPTPEAPEESTRKARILHHLFSGAGGNLFSGAGGGILVFILTLLFLGGGDAKSESLALPPASDVLEYDGAVTQANSGDKHAFVVEVNLIGDEGQPDDGRTVWVFTRPTSAGGLNPDDFYDGGFAWGGLPCDPTGIAGSRRYICEVYLGEETELLGESVEHSVWVGLVDQKDLRTLTRQISTADYWGGRDEVRPANVDLLHRLTYTRTS